MNDYTANAVTEFWNKRGLRPKSEFAKVWNGENGVCYALIHNEWLTPPASLTVGLRFMDGFADFSHSAYYTGYCFIPAVLNNDIDTWDVEVHGGITYDEATDGGMIYGFDCAHADDSSDKELQNIDWLTAECERMAAQFVTPYLESDLT